MFKKFKIKTIFISVIVLFFISLVHAEEEEVQLQAISDQIQVITKDIKTLEKAVYQKSDAISLKSNDN